MASQLTDRDEKPLESNKAPKAFLVAVILVPVVFFALLEGVLSLASYGSDRRQWIEPIPGKLVLNPDVGRRYFKTLRNIPVSNHEIFDAQKKPGSFRVFVLGESSGAGYPYSPGGSFSRWLQTRLAIMYPHCTIEVVNISMTAINSYTLHDLYPGVVEQQPDLVLIYAGHNEYYGAFGVGSAESGGAVRSLIRLSLSLQSFRSYELLTNFISAISGWFADDDTPKLDGTLMSRIARDQYISIDSPTYNAGLDQFDENMRNILALSREHGIPVIMGTLVSNLKDQRPFVSGTSAEGLTADSAFALGHRTLRDGDLLKADSLLRLAKDLDQLRFRAPEEMNDRIRRLAHEFGAHIADIDSAFRVQSPQGIIGDELMTDHLHPTLDGYRLMSDVYFDIMRDRSLLPPCTSSDLPELQVRETMRRTFLMTRLDSVLATYRIAVLKNDWPYVDRSKRRPVSELFDRRDSVDFAAYDVVFDHTSWEMAHRRVAGWYLSRGELDSFIREMRVLIAQYPFVVEYYDQLANELNRDGRYDEAFDVLQARYAIARDAYSSKWLGIINLSRGKTDEAVRFLEESVLYDANDPQTHYNLAGAYSRRKSYSKALQSIRKCLSLDPSFPRARDLERQLVTVVQ